MAEETFRPRKITPDDLANDPNKELAEGEQP